MVNLFERYSQELIELATYSRLLFERGFAMANGGNLSLRLDKELLITTPTGFSKGELTPQEMVFCNMAGERVAGEREPSSELHSHLALYRGRGDIKAIIHSHPPYCCSFAVTDEEPFAPITTESNMWLGEVTIVEYIEAGSPHLAQELYKLSQKSNCFLLRNHGIITCGTTLKEALWRGDIMERHCMLVHLTSARGAKRVEITK